MWITPAYAQETTAITTDAAGLDGSPDMPTPPGAMEAFLWNMGLIAVLMILFYVLLIMPQQRRFKEHKEMLDKLQKGDKVITGGGLIGKIDKIKDEREVIIDLGDTKVTALRSTIQNIAEPLLRPANDQKKK